MSTIVATHDTDEKASILVGRSSSCASTLGSRAAICAAPAPVGEGLGGNHLMAAWWCSGLEFVLRGPWLGNGS